jgi:hypothetical protein
VRVIFLDIDGVLNNAISSGTRWCTRLPRVCRPGKTSAVPPYDPECVNRFNWLVSATGAKVVVSDTYGRRFVFEAVVQYLTDQGALCEVVGQTEARDYRPRGSDIQAWLASWQGEPIESFCILDDHNDMGALRPYLVWTRRDTGLTEQDVQQAYRLLRMHEDQA